jgi:hypothetical protein
MTRQVVCDVCGLVIGGPAVQFAGGDYHDTPECIGAIQTAWAEAVAKVKKPAAK